MFAACRLVALKLVSGTFSQALTGTATVGNQLLLREKTANSSFREIVSDVDVKAIISFVF